MAVTKPYGIYGVTLADAVALGGVISCGCPINVATEEIQTDGNVYARFQSVMKIAPLPTFTTHSVAAALALVGVTGKDISKLGVGFLSLYAQQRLQGGTRAGATSHMKYNILDGLIVPTTLSASHDGSATITYVIYPTSAAGAAPMAITKDISLPAAAPGDAERFGLGTFKVGGITITQVTGFEVNFGINVEQLSADGDVYNSFTCINNIQPTMTIRTMDASLSAAAGVTLAGLNGTHVNTICFLRKRLAGGVYVPDITAGHIKFTAYGRIAIEEAFQGSGNDIGETSIVMTPISDGTSASPIIIDAAIAIT